MEQFGQRSNGGNQVRENTRNVLRLLEERLLGYQALAEALASWRDAYVQCDLNRLVKSVETQSSCCHQITAADLAIRDYSINHLAPGEHISSRFGPADVQRVDEILAETAFLRTAISRLNCAYAHMIAKAASNNAILRNVYANLLVYGDPRAGGPRRWLEK